MHEQAQLTGTVRLAAVGDLMLGDSAVCTGYGFASRYPGLLASGALTTLRPLLGPADLVIGNLECMLSQEGHAPRRWSSTQLRGAPEYANALRAAGFQVLNVANNHAYQHGRRAFFDTVALLHDAGIATCGVRGSGPWSSEPARLVVKGIRFGFLGYCLRPRQYSSDTPPYAEGTEAEITRDIRQLRSEVDQVVTSLHWGEEYVDQPSISEVQLARRLVDAGSSVILGHHPHVIRPVEVYRDAVIAYSLGNFISDMIWYPPLRRTAVLFVEVGQTVSRAEGEFLYIEDTYLPARPPALQQITPIAGLTGVAEAVYAAEVHRTVAEHRIASYRHALRNMHRFRFPTLLQLLAVTGRNKAAGVVRAFRRT